MSIQRYSTERIGDHLMFRVADVEEILSALKGPANDQCKMISFDMKIRDWCRDGDDPRKYCGPCMARYILKAFGLREEDP